MERPTSMNDLPPELLGEIFYQCTTHSPDAPLLLSRVSRNFHQVVYSTPGIWYHLHLPITETTGVACDRKVELWFSVGGLCMVDITLDVRRVSFDDGRAQSTSPSKELLAAELSVSGVLRRRVDRLRSLKLQASSEMDAQSFLDAIFTLPLDTDAVVALTSLTLQISPDARLAPIVNRGSSLPAQPHFPFLPKLTDLILINHGIAPLATTHLINLQTLSITLPIRFPSLPLHIILHILRSTTSLVQFNLEARVVDAPPPHSDHATGDVEHNNTLIYLPHLTGLSLRTNSVSYILPHLLLPNLTSLRIDDLDGRRIGSAESVENLLRKLLVRMDLPCPDRVGSGGLKTLELVNVPILRGAGETEGVWDWCFRRMKSLVGLTVSNIDASPLLDILASRSEEGEAICPQLANLSITSSTPPLEIEMFRTQRPDIDLKFHVIADPFGGGDFDFISHYENPTPAGAPSSPPSALPFRGSFPYISVHSRLDKEITEQAGCAR